MRVAVFGTGAVGGYFGGRLAEAGADVHFIARGENLEAMRAHGLQVESPLGDFTLRPVQAASQPDEVGPVDVVIVGVKAWQIPEAAEACRPLVGPHTVVLPLQNGVEAPAQLASVLGPEHVIGGLCKIFAARVAPGHIRHMGFEPYIAFGELDGAATERVERLRQAFAKARGLRVEVPADIHVALWDKFMFICAISGVGAVTRAPIGITRSLPETRRLLEAAAQEIQQVAVARGVALPAEAVPNMMASIDGMVPGATASMQRDILQGRPSELEAQNGAVTRLGRACGVPTPVNDYLYASLLPQERRARGQAEFD